MRRHCLPLLLLAVAGLREGEPRPALPHDPDGRIAAVSRRLDARPDDPDLLLLRGRLWLQARHAEPALRDFARVVALRPGCADARLGEACCLRELGRLTEALAATERCLQVAPDAGQAQWLRGRLLAQLQRGDEAAAQFQAALPAMAPAQPEHFLEAAAAAFGAGRNDAALGVLDQGLVALGPALTLLAQRAAFAVVLGRLPLGRLAPAATAMPALPTEQVLIPAAAVWRYRDDGSDQGTAWQQPGFDDSGWQSGPAQLGYGDGDEATVVSFGPDPLQKHVTTWFRHGFQVGNPGQFAGLRLRLLHDDGIVVHLNGTEVHRQNLPAGPVGHLTLASRAVEGSEERAWFSVPIATGALRNGWNVLAVEVHQVARFDGDVSFDVELRGGSGPATVLRGPYLQNGTPDAATIRWRTDIPTGSHVWLGPQPSALVQAHADPTLRTEHEVRLTGLPADTRLFYAIGDGGGVLAGGDAGHWLRTLPPPGQPAPARIWVLGDSGSANQNARAVRDAYATFTGARPTDVLLMLGDNAYDLGLDPEYQAAVFEMYPGVLRQTFLWPTLGNHDASSARSGSQSGVYYDVFSLPRNGEAGGVPSGTEAYYSFDRGHVHFVCLDSQDSDRSLSGAMLTWLRADLQANRNRWLIAFFHHPPYSKGSHDSDNVWDSNGRMRDMRQAALPILEQHGVDLVLTGHSHSYERSFLVDGHHGESWTLQPAMVLDRGDGWSLGDGAYGKPTAGPGAREGAVYVVAGSAGKISGGPLNHPVMYVGLNQLGSLVLDVDGDRLQGSFVTAAGTVADRFTIEKGVQRTLLRDGVSVSVRTGGRQDFRLRAGPQHAFRGYLLAGSFGTTPGFAIGPVPVPLNQDPWLLWSLAAANGKHYPGSFGVLDGNGEAKAAVELPSLPPGMAGVALHHAYVVFDAGGVRMASNAVKLSLRP